MVKVSRTSPAISHLMYADELVIFCRANEQEVVVVAECLNKFTILSGFLVNQAKSIIHFSKSVTLEVKERALNLLGMCKYDHEGK